MGIDLTIVTVYIYRYVGPVLFVLGIIGNFLNVIIFRSKTLRVYSCSMYYLVQSIVHLVFFCTVLPIRYLLESFQIDLTVQSGSFCKFHLVTLYVIRILSPCLLIWSCLDRYLSSSSNSKYRQMSQVKITKYTIPITIVCCFLLLIYVPIHFDVYQTTPTSAPVCYVESIQYSRFHSIIYAITSGVLPQILSILFSLLTLKNVRNQRQRIQHTISTVNTSTLHQRR
ncbi:unnamed protein product, partial [Didymodactylos carnosus]